MRKAITAIAVLALSATAQAQVYKCDTSGGVVFTDTPCQADASPIASTPATGPYNPAAAYAARMRHTQELARQRAAAAAQAQADAKAAAEDAARAKAANARCEHIRTEMAKAKRMAGWYHYAINIQREEQKYEHYREREFFECGR